MARKNKFDYFAAFEKQAAVACEDAKLLVECIEEFTTADELRDIIGRAHKIEQEGDEINHQILRSVAIDFITPIDREDIMDLAQRLDTVTDNIEGVIQSFYMYNVHFIHEYAPDIAKLILKATEALRATLAEFSDFKKTRKFRDAVEEVNACEEEADRLYLQAIRTLYTEEHDKPTRVEVWSRLFDRMEATCDSCEHVADTIGDIVLKNM